MRVEELDFECPDGIIAQHPVEPRDSCRLMCLDADGGRRHLVFSGLVDVLEPGDTLVFNNSRVLAARVAARKSTGGAVELLFLRRTDDKMGKRERWEVLARPSGRLRAGGELLLPDGTSVVLEDSLGGGRWAVEGPEGHSMVDTMESHGRLPVPPYVRSYPDDPSCYQTVYASILGSAAAPTAGLHFTPELLQLLEEMGIASVELTLHVGLDTFQPIRESVVEDHPIHNEAWSITGDAYEALRKAVAAGSRIVAVGTTAARVLETLAERLGRETGGDQPLLKGSTGIFITPGYQFRLVDALLTNFHLPRSSVLALTMAFAGVERIREAYAEAIQFGYRFFSFGDAMFIEKPAGSADAGGGAFAQP